MRGQERALHETPTAAWAEQYVLATASDKGVEVFRKWLYDCANGGPYFPRASRTLPAPDAMVFDRWQRHAKHCPRCKRVMRTFGSVQSWAGRRLKKHHIEASKEEALPKLSLYHIIYPNIYPCMHLIASLLSLAARLSLVSLGFAALSLHRPYCYAWLVTTMFLAAVARWAAAERWGHS